MIEFINAVVSAEGIHIRQVYHIQRINAMDIMDKAGCCIPGILIFGESLAGLIGWSAVSPLLTMVEWNNFSYRMARENLEEARDQRIKSGLGRALRQRPGHAVALAPDILLGQADGFDLRRIPQKPAVVAYG